MTRRLLAFPALLAGLLLVVGCAPTRVRETSVDAAVIARADALAALRAWSFDGRIAVSSGGRAGTGRIDWRQDGPYYAISVRAPIGGQSWQLSGDASMAQLEGLGPEPRLGPDADALLAREVGWTLPLAAVRDWVRGEPHGDDARVRRDVDGRPIEILDLGWRIEFRAWQPASAGLPAMPTRIIARRGEDDIRVSVAAWRVGGGG
jgi:outer membrane lipoprotein LolB